MLIRCENILKENESNQFKFAIILGGTNDLAHKLSGEEIFENLKKIHEICHKEGIKTICLSIPENTFVRKIKIFKLKFFFFF